jgi:D-glycero-D-manno-heptose 1,7-bisphosphate phosphatase
MTPTAAHPRRAAFLDRDGVINVDHGYVSRWDAFEFVPGAVQAMTRLHEAGYALVVVTNQSGIARGMYTEQDFQLLTRHMGEHLAAHGAPVAGVFHCPHHPKGKIAEYALDCACRKPQPGLLLQAIAQLGLDPAASLLVGDKLSDLQAARAAGVNKAYLITGKDGEEDALDSDTPPDGVFDSLAACVNALLAAAPSADQPSNSL